MKPNQKQQEAIDKINWPLLIIAWAWSWKTATLTARVQNMIENKWVSSSSILMVTFTNKAASEMKDRVAKTLGVDVPRTLFSDWSFPTIWTFHSIWIYFLKTLLNPKHNLYGEISERIGLRTNFVIYDESDKMSVLKSIIKSELNLDEKEFPARQIAFYISNAKNALITAKWYEKEIDNSLKQVVWEVYTKYEMKLSANNAMDFDDILTKTLALLKIPQILEYYQEKYKYLMVDEYQDTNAPQYEIVRLLASKYKNLAVVGDDSQSIYSWRWANLQNILNFKKDYVEAEVIKLEQNYRSTKNVILAANSVIKNNVSWVKKELWTENEIWEKITLIETPDDRLEAKAIVQIIKDSGEPYKDNLVLYRTNAQSRQIEEALLVKNIPYRVIWGLKFYDRKEIKDLLAYLRTVFNSDDVVSMKRIINTPTRKIGSKSIEVMDIYMYNFGIWYLELFENIDEVEELKPAAKKAIIAFSEMFNYLKKKSKEIEVSDLIKEVVDTIKYIDYITEWLPEEEKQAKKDNIDELINLATEYNGMWVWESLSQFLEEVALLTDMDKKETEPDYVTLMTIHTSKGLEQNRVFVTGLEDWIFPSFRSVNDSNALEEERRLMYVAMTRAKTELYLSRAKERFHFWDYVRNPESRFLKEVDPSLLQDYDLSGLFPKRDSFFWNSSLKFHETVIDKDTTIVRKVANNDVSGFARGDKISHPKFGNWIITVLNWETADIAFSGVGVKKMNIRIAPVRRI
jgi:DNA helicase-2/ATP-dependent DNA helicase PcrA